MKSIEQICRTFLWTGAVTISKKALVSWENICKPLAAGGLNIINLCLWNRAAILKQLWNIAKNKECLWIQWVHNYFIRRKDIEIFQIPKNASWVVRKILASRVWILQGQTRQGDLRSAFDAIQLGDKFSMPVHKRLATVDRLMKFGIQVPPDCAYCALTLETFGHLFFECQVTKSLWSRQCWETELRWMCLMAKKEGRAEIASSVFGMLVYVIWRERNRIKFENGRVRVEVLKEIVIHIQIKSQTRAKWQITLQLNAYPWYLPRLSWNVSLIYTNYLYCLTID
ncbi:hypothetical protein R3W88_003529 [Solanum pinnatisectum]|uniref:Reverse transcriptase zinc-binding domain-containing protein n=1 Tax=Solanum pinnatisectum TaxID=50273 RepID=A0AAV9MR39_9SOLN|nr:hypothetical protein R3W88_003529 [Solanum pinnatisectum]